MAQINNILQELEELNSGLGSVSRENIYPVPVGYFDNFSAQLLKRVKALEADNATEELEYLSPLLNAISRQTLYAVPAGYFEGVEKKLEQIISGDKNQTAVEELEEISPLLAGLKNKTTYTIPQGYFEKTPEMVETPVVEVKTKVVSITSRRWFRYAAAAVVIAFVAAIGFVLLNRGGNNIDPSEKSYAWIKKNMKKVSTDDITEFVELAGAGAVDVVKSEAKDDVMNSLLKDVSDKEIQDFLNDTQAAEPEQDDDLILN
jgi:hypothetical protein